MKKTFIMTTIVALIGMLSAGLLVPWAVQADTTSTELPTLTVETPKPSSPLYANNTLELHFNLTKPQSWNSYDQLGFPNVADAHIYIYLDGVVKYGCPSTTNTFDQYTAVFANLTQQQHTVLIEVYCSIYGHGTASVSQTLTFTIDAQAQTIAFHEDPVVTNRPATSPILPPTAPAMLYPDSPTATSTPTLNPTATPTPTSTPSVPEFPLVGAVFLLAMT